ncbi:MAG TPA: hypothetical protein VGX25_15780 [Actinophytocola sp.]|uniref:hypothetical protein n=1 Tax=Actinophytocola sp. TaxID=1872138 RepID=UPI002DDCBB66|nr:hypothetical protein [Actinophytocola sp.]HEV2780845.1 hypothetical protein [Actinophytocola sp.]
MLIRVSALVDLAAQLNCIDEPLVARWDSVDQCFQSWVAQPDLRVKLRNHLLELPADEAAAVINRSRETTTHFAWCVRDRPEEPFTFWLHEYKPQRDWRRGYADSVHNHRYHFCTTIVRGGYVHERYTADIDPATEMIASAALTTSTPCETGAVAMLLASEFHRIPLAIDTTVTFLVKSREVTSWSLSYDPGTQSSHRHIPVESRLDELAERI